MRGRSVLRDCTESRRGTAEVTHVIWIFAAGTLAAVPVFWADVCLWAGGRHQTPAGAAAAREVGGLGRTQLTGLGGVSRDMRKF